MTMTSDLDLPIHVPFVPPLSNCWAKRLQISPQASLSHGHSLHAQTKKSLAICTNSIYWWYPMFSVISQKRMFGRNY